MPTIDFIDINTIDLHKRVRYAETNEVKEYVKELADSIKQYGLLQPLLLGAGNVLFDGWCRYTACQKLGFTQIPVYFREKLTEIEYQEIELEANLRRLGFTWQEQVESSCRIHDSRTRQAILNGVKWTRQMTGELIGYSDAYVDNCFRLRPALESKDKEIIGADGPTEALRILLRRDEDKAVQEKAKRASLQSGVVLPNIADLLAGLKIPESVPTDNEVEQVVDLSHTLFQGDSARVLLPQWPEGCVDHVITDMPYAIDVANLQQAGDALIDVSRVEETHTVNENLDLYSAMFPAVFRVLKDEGFFITWCDIMNWQYLYDLAIKTGFKIQRWPITWHKTGMCKCQMAHVLFTKNTEIAIVCRKGNAILPSPVQTCVVTAANDATKVSNPFAKPFAVWEFLVESVSIEGQSILDPCAGEGTGTVATLRLNRKALAIEKDEKHFPYLLESVKNHWMSVFKKVKFV